MEYRFEDEEDEQAYIEQERRRKVEKLVIQELKKYLELLKGDNPPDYIEIEYNQMYLRKEIESLSFDDAVKRLVGCVERNRELRLARIADENAQERRANALHTDRINSGYYNENDDW